MWVYYSAGNPRRTVLARFTRAAGSGTIDRDSQQVVLEVPQPFPNHNGGAIRFGPDGMLYLGLGDGGSGGDPSGNGQNLNTLLGKIIRLDVRATSAAQPYAIPPDNPFTGRPGARGEVWAFGLRNPWRMAFDPPTGRLWVGDVGQNSSEEIDVVVRGGNYGWNFREGTEAFQIPPYRGVANRSFSTAVPPPPDPDRVKPEGLKFDDPVFTYYHPGLAPAGDFNTGNSVTGGFVYRGDALPALKGRYLFADYASGKVWALEPDGERRVGPERVHQIASIPSVSSFGLDPRTGDILIASLNTGHLLRLVPATRR